MPTLKLTTDEAKRLKAKRARDKAYNTVLYEVVNRLKPRLKKADPIEAAIVTSVLADIRKMVR
jgi:hypothetical protein